MQLLTGARQEIFLLNILCLTFMPMHIPAASLKWDVNKVVLYVKLI